MVVSLSELRELVMDREAWPAAILWVAKSWTRLSDWTELIIFILQTIKLRLRKIKPCSQSRITSGIPENQTQVCHFWKNINSGRNKRKYTREVFFVKNSNSGHFSDMTNKELMGKNRKLTGNISNNRNCGKESHYFKSRLFWLIYTHWMHLILQTRGSQILAVADLKRILLKETDEPLSKRFKDSASWKGVWEFAFQTSFQVMLILLVQAHQFEKLLCKLLSLECPLKVGYLKAPWHHTQQKWFYKIIQ